MFIAQRYAEAINRPSPLAHLREILMTMAEWISAAQFAGRVVKRLGISAKVLGLMIAQSAMTVTLILVLYAGYFIMRERDLVTGISMAFLASHPALMARSQNIKSAMQQAELRTAINTDILLDQLMGDILNTYRGAARVRIAVIHNGVVGLSGMSLLKAEVINARAAPGRSPGEFTHNISLSTWAPFMPALVRGECAENIIEKMPQTQIRQWLVDIGVILNLACPIIDIKGQMLGAIFVHFDRQSEIPVGDEMKRLKSDIAIVTKQIAAAWSIRGNTDPVPPVSAKPKTH